MSDKYHVRRDKAFWGVFSDSGHLIENYNTEKEAQQAAKYLATLEVPIKPIRDRYYVARTEDNDCWVVKENATHSVIDAFDNQAIAHKACDAANKHHRENQKPKVVFSDDLMLKLQHAGVIGENNVRVIIDLHAGEPIRIYTTYGSDVCLEVLPDALKGAEVYVDGVEQKIGDTDEQ